MAYIGWVDLEAYRAAGSKMRTRKQVEREWREPIQPDGIDADGLVDSDSGPLFGQTAEEMRSSEERFRIQA